jgi:hypothetical protein
LGSSRNETVIPVSIIDLLNYPGSTLEPITEISNCVSVTPPDTISFVLLVALVTTIAGIPMLIFFDFVRLELCAKRPDLSVFGLSNEHWLGSTTRYCWFHI